ncbi:hypothetical protein IIA29_03045, partial [candidate division KSB1 bacterium]|nr:hypothetical protein [candidate division KSB1 bacterium]
FAIAEQTTYRYTLRHQGKVLSDYAYSRDQSQVSFNVKMSHAIARALTNANDPSGRDRIFSFRIETQRGQSGYKKYVDVYFYLPLPGSETPELVALERQN